MTRILIAVAALSMFTACSASDAYTADGGHKQFSCSNVTVTLPVKVLDVNKNPVAGAKVTATNRATGKTLTGTTDSNGSTTSVTEAIGQGDVDLRATEGARTSDLVSSLWTCGSCDCVVEPPSATLTVQ